MSIDRSHWGMGLKARDITLSGDTPVDGSLFIGVPGDVVMTLREDDPTDFKTYTLAAGWHPVLVREIRETGTTASQIKAIN